MEVPESVEPNEISIFQNQPKKIFSDSEIYSKQLSITSDADVDENLHIIGFKVKVGSDAYSFNLGKATRKSSDVLTIVADSKQLQLASIDPGENFEDQMQSKDDAMEAVSENESLNSSSDTKEQIPAFLSMNPQVSCSIESSTQPEGISFSATQTDQEFESSGVQTSRVEVKQPRSTQTTMIQTDRTQNVSTTTNEVETDSVKVQTDVVWKKQAAVQTEMEKISSFAQTETAINSTDRVYNASTETEKREDIGTSTNFDAYAIDRENLMKKSLDTEDFPFTPLIVAKREIADIVLKRSDVKDCNCFCGHRNHHRCIYKCCTHNDSENVIPGSLQCNNHVAKFSNGLIGCNYCHCPSRNSRNETNTCNSMFRMDLHQSHCCKCGNLQTKGVQLKVAAKVETKDLKLPESIKVSKMRFDSLAQQEKVSNHSKGEVAKTLENGLEKNKIIIAERLFKCRKVERVSVLKVPVVFEYFLKSFNLSLYSSLRVVVNPIKISLTLAEKAMFPKQKDAIPNYTFLKEKLIRDQKDIVVSCYDAKIMPLQSSCAPEVNIVFDKRKSQVCSRSKGYSNNQRVSEIKDFSQSDSKKYNAITENNVKTSDNQGRSTSPKIKHRGFDYISKDKWKPHHPKRDDVLVKKLKSTDITLVDQSSSEESFERVKNMFLKDACETVNDHLLSLRFVDENAVRAAAEILHKQWFEVAGTKHSDVQQVRYYMQYFEEFSNNLLRTLLYSVDNNGNNVLHFAFANNRFDLVEEFLKNGFAVNLLNKTNKIGNTPLMICSISQPKSNSEWSTVRKALKMGDIDAKSKKSGQTALMNASSSGFYTMVHMLLDLGANPNVQDKDGSTALMYAAEHGHERCIKYLIKNKKCDPTMQDKDGQTACSIALCNNHRNIAVLIHMKALEKRRFSKNLYASQRYIWTNNVEAPRMKELSMLARCLR